jgi:hypothetical protein
MGRTYKYLKRNKRTNKKTNKRTNKKTNKRTKGQKYRRNGGNSGRTRKHHKPIKSLGNPRSRDRSYRRKLSKKQSRKNRAKKIEKARARMNDSNTFDIELTDSDLLGLDEASYKPLSDEDIYEMENPEIYKQIQKEAEEYRAHKNVSELKKSLEATERERERIAKPFNEKQKQLNELNAEITKTQNQLDKAIRVSVGADERSRRDYQRLVDESAKFVEVQFSEIGQSEGRATRGRPKGIASRSDRFARATELQTKIPAELEKLTQRANKQKAEPAKIRLKLDALMQEKQREYNEFIPLNNQMQTAERKVQDAKLIFNNAKQKFEQKYGKYDPLGYEELPI